LSSPTLAFKSVQYHNTGPGPWGGMTIDLLIHAIVRQTTILIAQLATSRGLRAPLAQIANQVFLDLVAELERQRVSRRVSADMFGLGLRTYRRKIQRLSESATERGRSLWEVVLEYLRARSSATRAEVLKRFSGDEESQVKAVLHDLCESQLVVASGTGATATYRAARGEELIALQQGRGAEGLDELLLALMFREPPLTVEEIARQATMEVEKVEPILNRLVNEGSVERTERDGVGFYQATRLVVPLGATAGWEAAVFDHYKALVATLICRLRDGAGTPQLEDTVGGSTYTLSVWPGHPMADEVYGTMKRLRAELSSMRERVAKHNQECELPEAHTRVVIYLGQSRINEGSEPTDHD
jgi:DNA-binding MarR family transcriptional regulator